MRRWGYRHVITPMVESLDVLELGLGSEQRRRLFKFTDARGEVVALVSERTVPVARVVAGKLRSAPLPIRLCYAGPVLSTDEGRFQQRRETYQVGAELVGASGAVADAEVIALAARCLEATGLRRYQDDPALRRTRAAASLSRAARWRRDPEGGRRPGPKPPLRARAV